MKKVLIALALILSMNSTIAQNKKIIIKHNLSNSEISGPTGVICSNQTRTKWFTLTPNYMLDGNRLLCDGFIVIRLNIGNLKNGGTLAFTFKDGSKIRLKSKVQENRYDALYFPLSELNFIILKSKEIKYVRYINKTDYASLQYTMTSNESNYYVNLFTNYSIQRGNFK